MITAGWFHITPEQVMALLWRFISFFAGVAWAAYRAVGWADRIRSWAATCPIESEESVS